MILLESERLYVRYLKMDDLDDYFRIIGDNEVMQYIRAAKTYEESREFLKEVINSYNDTRVNLRLAIIEKSSNQLIGSFAIIPVVNTPETQLGYSFLKPYWGKGFATEITLAGLRYAFDTFKLESIDGITEKENRASQKVLLKCGFVFEKEYLEFGKELVLYRKKR